MSAPPTSPVEIVRGMSRLTERLYTLVGQYADAEREATELRHAADVAEARAFMQAPGAVEARKKAALIAVDDAEMRALVAEALVRTLRAKIKATETDIDCHRTYNNAMQAELKTLGAVS